MRIIPFIALSIAGAAASACAAHSQQQAQREIGAETKITFAANGGIRNWQAGPPDSGVLYMQDRSLNWYKVEMSGPCIQSRGGPLTVHYTTDTNGTFDRFSTLSFPDYGERTCGVKSITASTPPPGQPGAPKADSGE